MDFNKDNFRLSVFSFTFDMLISEKCSIWVVSLIPRYKISTLLIHIYAWEQKKKKNNNKIVYMNIVYACEPEIN